MRAVVRYVERCGGRISFEALDHVFIEQRGYSPAEYYGARFDAVRAGLLAVEGALRRTES